MTMFERVVVDVIEVALVIALVPNQVFPIAPLPDAPLAAVLLASAERFADGQALAEGELDDLPA